MSRERVENQRRQAEVAEIEKSAEPERKPWSGAGSMSGHHMLIGQPEYKPTSARDRVSHAERFEFFRTQELEPLAERITREIEGTTKATIEWHKKMSELLAGETPWEQLISAGIIGKEIFDGLERGDCALESNLDREAFTRAFDQFKSSPPYQPYHELPLATQGRVIEVMLDIFRTQHISPFYASNWARLLAICESAGFIFPPLQPQAAPAPIAEDGGEIVATHEGKACSQAMINRLPADLYAEVLNLRESREQRCAREEREQQEQRNRQDEYATKPVAFHGGRGYTQKELDALPADQYRVILGLRKGDSSAAIVKMLLAGGSY